MLALMRLRFSTWLEGRSGGTVLHQSDSDGQERPTCSAPLMKIPDVGGGAGRGGFRRWKEPNADLEARKQLDIHT